MADKDKTEADNWPLKETFFVEIEEHCEDGEWSGYAHSDKWPRSTEAKEAILKSVYDKLAARVETLEAALAKFKVWGTDGCRGQNDTCQGRITLFITDDRCLECLKGASES